MRSQDIEMTFEDWERMPWRFGWKHEYWDGHAHISPRHKAVIVRLTIEPRDFVAPQGFSVRRVSRRDSERLIDTFLDAFGDGVEYCDYKPEAVKAAAHSTIVDYFSGKRGAPHRSSRLAIVKGEQEIVVGAALLVKKRYGLKLDLVMVRPRFQRRGLAKALTGAALNELHGEGVTMLRSAYHAANEASGAWHCKFGFEEEPDLELARLRRSFFQHELWRAREIGANGAAQKEERKRLKQQYDYWNKETRRLEAIAEAEGYDAVCPVLRSD